MKVFKLLLNVLLLLSVLISNIKADSLQKISLQLKWKYQFQFAGFLIAKEKGYYKDLGLDVNIKELQSNTNIMKDIETSTSTFAISDSSLVYEALKGKEVLAVMPILQNSPFVLIGLKNSNTQYLEDLNDKNIALYKGIDGIAVSSMLKSNQIKYKAKKPIFDIKKLYDDDIDFMTAYLSNEPYLAKKNNINIVTFAPKDYGFEGYGDILFTSKEVLKKNPDLVSKMYQASLKGWKYAFNNIDESVNLLYEKYNTLNKSKDELLYEAYTLKKLSGIETNFAKFDIEKIKGIAQQFNLLKEENNKLDILDDFLYRYVKPVNPLTLSSKEKDFLQKKKNFTVCAQYNFFPLDAVVNDKLYGIAGDIFKIIEKELNINIKAIESNSNFDLEEKVRQNKCDFVSMLFTHQKRFSKIKTSNPIFTNRSSIITTIDKSFSANEKYTKEKKFIVLTKPYKSLLSLIYPNLNIIYKSENEEIKKLLLSGEAYGFIYPDFLSDYKVRELGYQDFKISGFLTKKSKYLDASTGVVNTYPLLLSSVNKVIQNTNKEQIDQILNRWDLASYQKETDYTLVWKIFIIFLIIIIIGSIFTMILRKNNKRLHVLLNSSIEAIAIFKNGKIIEANEPLLTLYGYSSISEIRGKDAYSFVEAKNYSFLKEKLEGTHLPYEINTLKKDGTLFPTLVKGTKLDKNTRITSIIDLSELKIVQNKLENLNKSLASKIVDEGKKNEEQQLLMLHQSRFAQMGEMIAMIAHQWRQPLNNLSIINQTIILKYKRDKLNKELMEKFGTNSMKQIQLMSNTIDDFRNFFMPRKEKSDFCVNDVLSNTLDIINPIISKENIQIHFNKKNTYPTYGYKNELGQVFLNIISNSKDALLSKEIKDKNIFVDTKLVKNTIEITFNDNAGGIDESILGKIFDPYFSTKSGKNGTGLGLYMSKIIIEEHMKGKIDISNNKKGALFTIKLTLS